MGILTHSAQNNPPDRPSTCDSSDVETAHQCTQAATRAARIAAAAVPASGDSNPGTPGDRGQAVRVTLLVLAYTELTAPPFRAEA
jgi:hypothetical protein